LFPFSLPLLILVDYISAATIQNGVNNDKDLKQIVFSAENKKKKGKEAEKRKKERKEKYEKNVEEMIHFLSFFAEESEKQEEIVKVQKKVNKENKTELFFFLTSFFFCNFFVVLAE